MPALKQPSKALVVLLFFCACAPRRGLSAREAAELIQNATDFIGNQKSDIKSSVNIPCDSALQMEQDWKRLHDAGLIQVKAGNRGPGGAGSCEAVLTVEARNTSADEPVAALPQTLTVVTATRNLVSVGEIRAAEGGASEAAFIWQWQPTAVGEKQGLAPVSRSGSALLYPYDDGWRVVSLKLEVSQ